jgi:hypothetical protein
LPSRPVAFQPRTRNRDPVAGFGTLASSRRGNRSARAPAPTRWLSRAHAFRALSKLGETICGCRGRVSYSVPPGFDTLVSSRRGQRSDRAPAPGNRAARPHPAAAQAGPRRRFSQKIAELAEKTLLAKVGSRAHLRVEAANRSGSFLPE